MQLATIGYEGATQAEVIAALRHAGVKTLIDVRAIAASRRPGFAKTALKNGLDTNGIAYLHLPGLGTPKPGREAARAGKVAEMHRIFLAHMHTPEAQADLQRAIERAGSEPCCLLCLEHDHTICHRFLVAQAMQARAPFTCVHLCPEAAL